MAGTVAGYAVNSVVLNAAPEGPAGAPALVFSNSLGTDLRVWDPLLPHLPTDWRRLRYDKRGHGLSALPDVPWSIEDLADDLDALMDAASIDSAVIVGLSVGGLIAQSLAVRHPARVRALVLCDTAARIGTDEMWNDRIAAIEEAGLAAQADAIMARWFTEGFRADPARLAPWRNMMLRTPAEGYLATCRAIRDADYREAASRLAVPSLAVCGEADGSTPPALVRQTAALIPDCRFELIADAGHIPCVEQPEVLGALIGDFVSAL
ncbi:MAG: 3-oxoadipate enol-lactonase [Pseudomonadota bacterium]